MMINTGVFLFFVLAPVVMVGLLLKYVMDVEKRVRKMEDQDDD